MFYDAFATDRYVLYNTFLATKIGLHEAIYVGILTNINKKAEDKNKVSNGMFILDREYVRSQTTFDIPEQKRIEKALSELGIIKKSTVNQDSMCINTDAITSIFLTNDEKELKKISVNNADKKKKAARDRVIDSCRAVLSSTDGEIRDAYINWVGAVYDKFKNCSPTLVQIAEDYNRGKSKELTLSILKYATAYSYREMSFAHNIVMREQESRQQNVYQAKTTLGTTTSESTAFEEDKLW